MAWIESHQGLARHPKTKKLARILEVSLPASVGHLHLLWWWAMDYAADGDLSRYDSGDLADASGWEGEPQIIVNALIESGFLEESHDGLFIHDWNDYVGRLIEKREQNKERKKKSRARHAPVTRPSQECPSDDRESHRATVPYLTVPNQTKPINTINTVDNGEPQTMTEAYTFVFRQNIVPPQFTSFLIPIIQAHGEKYAIELILETGQSARSGPSLKFMQSIHEGWQQNGIKSRAESKAQAKANKERRQEDAKPRTSPARGDNQYDRLSL